MAASRIIAIVIGLLLLSGLVVFELRSRGTVGVDGTTQAEIGGETFTLEVAADDASITRGLMFRESIDPDGGMIFVFRQPRIANFWMKNCLVDIDLLYLDEMRRIVQLEKMEAQPPRRADEGEVAYEARIRLDASYPSEDYVSYAIELKSGSIDRLGLSVGDRVEFDHRALKKLVQ